MTAALSLSNLPVEVITNTFKCMDRPSLQSCCLVSHDFNEIATPVLYRSLIVEVALQQSIDPFKAFERRPQLYRAVQTVKFVDKLRWKSGNYRYLKDEEFEPIVKHLSLCRSDLALDCTGVHIYDARQYYNNILKKLDNVEELCLNWRYLFDFEGLPSRLRRISIVNLPIRERAENWLKSRNNILEELILPFWVRNIQSWESFVAAARSMKRLEDITFSVEKCELKLTKVALDPLSLPRLHSLNVTIYGCRKPPLVDTIYYVYETLAVSSKVVENLKIKIWYSDRIHQYEGGKLARLIAHNHGSTIRSLIIDDMILSSENLSYLCLQCPNLETLGFGVPKPTIMTSQNSIIDGAIDSVEPFEQSIISSADSQFGTLGSCPIGVLPPDETGSTSIETLTPSII
ncbi:hypothetical protein CPB86DRAFT_793075 [Serendipita vermifera]|nr:hypothetical protein CPB86DRAFT_793075 [Serendipita vermifera]